MGRSFWEVLKVTPGFRPEHVLTLGLRVPDHRVATSFYPDMLNRVGQRPGIVAAAVSDCMPTGFLAGADLVPLGRMRDTLHVPTADACFISADYFRALGIALVAGRFFSDRDGADRVEREIRSMQSLAVRADKWTPPIIKTVATEGKGIPELAAAIVNYEQFLQQKDLLLKKKISSWRERLIEMLRDRLLERLLSERMPESEIARLAADVAEHRRDPYSLVEEIVGGFTGAAHHGGTEARRKEKVQIE